MINLEVEDLINNTQLLLEKYQIQSVEDVRKCPVRLVTFSSEMEKMRQELQSFLWEHLYQHYRVVRISQKSRRFIEEIFQAYIKDIHQLPRRYQKRLAKEDKYRVICDYIAGMTDRYAQEEYKKLFYPFEKM